MANPKISCCVPTVVGSRIFAPGTRGRRPSWPRHFFRATDTTTGPERVLTPLRPNGDPQSALGADRRGEYGRVCSLRLLLQLRRGSHDDQTSPPLKSPSRDRGCPWAAGRLTGDARVGSDR